VLQNSWLFIGVGKPMLLFCCADFALTKHGKEFMKIEYKNVVLRDMKESDINDDIRWNTVQTEWALWDAPWEMEEFLQNFDPKKYREEVLAELLKPKTEPRWGFEVDTAGGVHIGSVNSYMIDENYSWIPFRNVKSGQKAFRTVGIEICESSYWGRGLGTEALAAFIKYYLSLGEKDICTQTWSGNTRMVKSALRLGFEEVHRETGSRNVRGGTYDGLTFLLNEKKFKEYLKAQ